MANIGSTPSDLGALNPQTDPRKYTTIDELLKANKEDNRDLLVKSYGDQGILIIIDEQTNETIGAAMIIK